MKVSITNFNEIQDNQLYSKNFYFFINDLFRLKSVFGFENGGDIFNFIISKINKGKECYFNSSYIKGNIIGNKNVEFCLTNLNGISYPMKKKIESTFYYLTKREQNEKKEGIKSVKNFSNKDYIEKIMNQSYTVLTDEKNKSYNTRLINNMELDRLVFYDLETTTSKELLLGYFTSMGKDGTIRNTFLLNEKFKDSFFEERVKVVVDEINRKYGQEFGIYTFYLFLDEKYKKNFLQKVEEKKSFFIGYNSIAFDNLVMARSMVKKGEKDYFKRTDLIHSNINKISMDLFEYYSNYKENCALDVILQNNLKGARKLMDHKELLPMLSYEFLNNMENIKKIDGFIYYNIFDVLLIVLLYFKNFKTDSFGYKNILSKDLYIEYIKGKLNM